MKTPRGSPWRCRQDFLCGAFKFLRFPVNFAQDFQNKKNKKEKRRKKIRGQATSGWTRLKKKMSDIPDHRYPRHFVASAIIFPKKIQWRRKSTWTSFSWLVVLVETSRWDLKGCIPISRLHRALNTFQSHQRNFLASRRVSSTVVIKLKLKFTWIFRKSRPKNLTFIHSTFDSTL